MKAALLTAFGQPLQLAEVPLPAPAPGQVLVQVEACGVCHSDLHVARGDWPVFRDSMKLPMALGHEVVGRVAALGPGVTRLREGQEVGVAWFHRTCGECFYCRRDAEVFCEKADITGITVPGGFGEYLLAWEDHALPLPPGLAAHQAAPLFCAGGTVFSALLKVDLKDSQLGVWGAGGLGHLAIQLGRFLGAHVTAVDIRQPQLDLARKAGASAAIQAGGAADWFARRENQLDVVLVCSPVAESYRQALSSLKKNGTLLVVGLPADPLVFGAGELVRSGVRIVPSRVSSRAELRDLLDIAAQGHLRTETSLHPLESVNGIFELLEQGQVTGRAVIDFRPPPA